AEFRATGAHQRRHALDGETTGIACDRRAAAVVAVEPDAGVRIQLRSPERPDDRTALWTDQTGVASTAVGDVARVDVEAIAVDAKTCLRAQPRRPHGFILRESPRARLDDSILSRRAEPDASHRVIEAEARDVVVPHLSADDVLRFVIGPAADSSMRQLAAGDVAVIALLELVAVDWIVQEEGEVREEIQVGRAAVRRSLRRRGAARALPLDRPAVTVGVAAVAGIDGAEAVDRAGLDGALRHLVGGAPPARIAHAGERQAVDRVAAAVA